MFALVCATAANAGQVGAEELGHRQLGDGPAETPEGAAAGGNPGRGPGPAAGRAEEGRVGWSGGERKLKHAGTPTRGLPAR